MKYLITQTNVYGATEPVAVVDSSEQAFAWVREFLASSPADLAKAEEAIASWSEGEGTKIPGRAALLEFFVIVPQYPLFRG